MFKANNKYIGVVLVSLLLRSGIFIVNFDYPIILFYRKILNRSFFGKFRKLKSPLYIKEGVQTMIAQQKQAECIVNF